MDRLPNILSKQLILPIIFLCPGLTYSQDEERVLDSQSNRLYNTVEEFPGKGIQFLDQGLVIDAIDYFDNFLKENPENFEAWYLKALAQEKSLDYRSAIHCLETSLRINPAFAEGLFSLAMLYYKTGNYQAAKEKFEHLADMPLGETNAVYFRGIKYGEDARDTEFNQLISMANKEADIYNYLGLCYLKAGDPAKSINFFNQSIQSRDNDDNIYVNRGLAWSQINRNDYAINDYRKALSINPDNMLAKLNLSMIAGDSTGIPDPLFGLAGIDMPEVFAYRAYIKFNGGDLAGAISDYDSAIFLDEDNPDFILNRGIVFEKANEFELALKDLRTAELLEPGNPKIYFHQGNIYFKLKHFSQSINSYTRAIHLEPGNGANFYNRAISYYYLNQPDSACLDAVRAVNLGMKEAEPFVEQKCPGKY
ncbi:MAG TPA: tetratricopeptide repeat protein [Cyclobacteriaceae bacterium]|nr:tetratricopeptide repeat protein [Cyclobacteriaceae bacterium]